MLIDGGVPADNRPADGSEVLGFDLDISGTQLTFHLAATGEAQLSDIVPAARAICGKITAAAREQLPLGGGCVPCRKGCSACCNYLVSMSAPEVFRFRQEIFPKAKYSPDALLRGYLLAARRLVSHRPPEGAVGNPDDLGALSRWYASLHLACPFLYGGECAIYHQRPLVCREHLVTGSARGCRGGSAKAEAVELPARMGNILCRLTKELCDVDDAVMLPLALAWYEENKQLDERRWPAATIAGMFFEIVEEAVSVSNFH